jgi:hypothetical protein
MIAYKLAAALFTEVILFPLVFFPISGYVRAVAMGAFDFYDDLHNFIVFLYASVVITPLSYFLDHHPIMNLLGDYAIATPTETFMKKNKEKHPEGAFHNVGYPVALIVPGPPVVRHLPTHPPNIVYQLFNEFPAHTPILALFFDTLNS